MILSAILLMTCQSLTAKEYKLTSPDGKIRFLLCDTGKELSYKVYYCGKEIISKSAMGFELPRGECFGQQNIFISDARTSSASEEYDLPVGKKTHVCDEYRQLSAYANDCRTGRKVQIFIRAFNDGVAYKYLIPEQKGWDKLVIVNELSEFNPCGDPIATTLMFDGYINSHEGLYNRAKMSEQTENRLIDMPMLLEFPSCYMSVTESNIVDYAGMYLVRKGDRFVARLSPKLTNPGISVEGDIPHRTPWRVMLIADKPGKLIESTVITSLADPCKITDLSWLKPGKTTFPWWCDTVVPKSLFQWGNNFETAKYYIDFAAESGLEYHSVYGYADMPWYYDDGPGFSLAGPNADLTRYDPRLDFPRVCKYAQSKGVDIHVWLNWAALYKDIDRVFDKFNEWGVKGMMVDFMDRNDQEMIQIQETILKKAAEHKLFIQFHGASKPSGLVRTYPNEFTREGTLNYEVYKWDSDHEMGADHDISMPFTRLVAGAADYHLGGFRSVPQNEFEPQYHAPVVTSTRCHMLGMYLVLESYLAMVCDYPDAYRGQSGFDFLCSIPTNWDDTVVPAASVTEYCCVARRKGEEWWMGCINNSKEREIEVKLDFLEKGVMWNVDACMDDYDCDKDPNHIRRLKFQVKAGETIKLMMSGSGGFAIHFTK